jgi:L-asparagine transporter-like permease
MRKLRNDIKVIAQSVIFLAIFTLFAVVFNAIGNMKMLIEMIQETSKLGISIIIGLIAIAIACMSFQSQEARTENKNFYMNYLTLMLIALLFLLTIFWFPYLSIDSNKYMYYFIFIVYFLFGTVLLGLSLIGTHKIIKRAFE